MRPTAGLALLLLAAALAACDTTQPELVGAQPAILTFETSGLTAPGYRTWTMFEETAPGSNTPKDVDGDGVADEFLWCELIGTTAVPSLVPISSAPWNFTATLKKLLPGATSPIVIGQSDVEMPALSSYDTDDPGHTSTLPTNVMRTHPRGRCTLDPSILCNPNETMPTQCADYGAGTCVPSGNCSLPPTVECVPGQTTCAAGACVVPNVTRSFDFLNNDQRRRLSLANEEALTAPPNILYYTDRPFALTVRSVTTGVTSSGGICPDPYPGPANVAGQPLPLELQLEKGATLIVEARILPGPPQGMNFDGQVTLASRLFVNGTPAAVSGNPNATGVDGIIQYTYQSQ